uniref:non-specific serine/threonine protein kinase n=1 Tax=Leptobrachium leishanense TaxID=445787 RepID=A0A8C5P6L2_9ANUR
MSSENAILRSLDYTVETTIGEGSYSKVKVAFSKKYGKRLDVKVLNKKQAAPEFVNKFLPRELAIVKTTNHPNVVRVFELIELTSGLQFIVMELCYTDLLQKVQKTGPLLTPEAQSVFSQIVIHRELKCENVLLTHDQCVKLSDFEFARSSVDPTDLSSTFCGTVAYAPPEVRSMTYGVGIILYILVPGKMPFDDSNINKLPQIHNRCRSVLHFHPHKRPDISHLAVIANFPLKMSVPHTAVILSTIIKVFISIAVGVLVSISCTQ